jgi:threonine/homoserine/homoserine lactone efflux protein
MIDFLAIGTILGLSAGFSPGPLLTLVVSETLQHNMKAGIKVALAPLVTDLPIIALTVFILSKLSNFQGVLGMISLIGGGVILNMGYKSIRTRGIEIATQAMEPKSLLRGVLVNALSPNPYLFWLSIGAPLMVKAIHLNVMALLSFIVSFYFFLVGSKILLAFLIGKSKSFLSGNVYRNIMRFLGLVLCIFAFILFFDGLKLLGVIRI